MRARPTPRPQHLPGCLVLLAGVVAGPLHAQPAVPGAECLRVPDPAERLQCFDQAIGKAAGEHGETASPSAPAAAPAAAAESGAAGPQDMGKVMAVVKPQMAGRADMGKVSALIKSKLGG